MNIFSLPQAAYGPVPHPAPALSAWAEAFLAFLLHWSGLLDRSADSRPDSGHAALREALQALATLIATTASNQAVRAAAHPDSVRDHANTAAPWGYRRSGYPRIPRAWRRLQLVPGIFAALFFTRRAVAAARTRRALVVPTPFRFLGLQALLSHRAYFVPLS